MAALQAHLSDAEVYDAIAVVGLLNLANRSALATGITVGRSGLADLAFAT